MIDIYGTLGPACAESGTLEEMFRLGMTGLRLNLSHVTLPEAAPLVEALHSAAARAGVSPRLLIDMQGPEVRVGKLPEPLALRTGDTVRLDRLCLPEAVRQALEPGQELLLDDGKLLLCCETVARAKVLRGGVLHSRKSAALPGKEIRLPALTGADRANLALARDYGVTGVMQPFVRGRADLEAVREALPAGIRLFAKVESLAGERRLPGKGRALHGCHTDARLDGAQPRPHAGGGQRYLQRGARRRGLRHGDGGDRRGRVPDGGHALPVQYRPRGGAIS